jgi:peptidoglycan/xylan/chitin deacetylase (PgdA/CDA1 family)
MKVRLQYACRRLAARWCQRRTYRLQLNTPIVSFTFDDFPRTALHNGGTLLREHGASGTFFASVGMMGQDAPTGRIFVPDDLVTLLDHGHELACHTYDHCHAWKTRPADFETAILKNRHAVAELVGGVTLTTLSYPLSQPSPGIKRIAGRYFKCCRAGGQTFNVGTVDLNCLNGFFIEQSSGIDAVKKIIDATAMSNGWLILATHDVTDSPTRFGCTPSLFRRIVRYVADSGCTILPVNHTLGVATFSARR